MYIYFATIKDGKLDFEREKGLQFFLKNNDGKRVVVKISKAYGQRSIKQNKLYWAYLNIIEAETGDNAVDLHEYFRRKLLPPQIIKVRNKEFEIPQSTTKLDKLVFSEYLQKIERLTGIPIPDINLI